MRRAVTSELGLRNARSRRSPARPSRQARLSAVTCGVCGWIPNPGATSDVLFRVLVHLERVHGVVTGVYEPRHDAWRALCWRCMDRGLRNLEFGADFDPWRCAGCGAWLPPPGGAQ